MELKDRIFKLIRDFFMMVGAAIISIALFQFFQLFPVSKEWKFVFNLGSIALFLLTLLIVFILEIFFIEE